MFYLHYLFCFAIKQRFDYPEFFVWLMKAFGTLISSLTLMIINIPGSFRAWVLVLLVNRGSFSMEIQNSALRANSIA